MAKICFLMENRIAVEVEDIQVTDLTTEKGCGGSEITLTQREERKWISLCEGSAQVLSIFTVQRNGHGDSDGSCGRWEFAGYKRHVSTAGAPAMPRAGLERNSFRVDMYSS